MPVDRRKVPAPGYTLVSGKRQPTEGEYFCQFRNGLVDEDYVRTPAQMRWIHNGHDFDVVAVKRVGD